MQITKKITVEATPDQVVAALLSNELAAKRMAMLGVTDYTHTVTGNVATTTVAVPAQKLPSQARTFVKNDVKAVITGTASGNVVAYNVDVKGVPVKIAMTATADAAGAATSLLVDSDVAVKIPFVGAKVEKMAAGKVDGLLAKDAALVTETIKEMN